jgi:Zn-dependent peptidase ImmA (M78 family)
MSSKNDIDFIINNLSQSKYTFGEKELSFDEILQIKNQSKDARGRYGLNAPIGTNIFSFLEQKGDIVFQLQDFKESELDAMIIKYSAKSQKKYIIINSDKPLINQIFAAAHEFYHYLYSFIGNSQDSIVCTFSKNDKEEIKANRFAAEFLLPEEALKDEVNSFSKFIDGKFLNAPIARQIVFCFYLTTKYSIPLKAVMYRLREENISNTDYLLNHYEDVKQILLDFSKSETHVKELYANKNEYITEQLYNLVPYLYNKGRLDDSTVDEIIKKFSLSEKQILGDLIKDE